MLGKVISPKYLYPGSLVVGVHIKNIVAPNTLIDIGATTNSMTKETTLNLNLKRDLRRTTTMLQVPHTSIEALDGVIEDVMVSIYS